MTRGDRTTAKKASLRGETILFGVLVVLHLIPIWAFAHFPSQDGPTHLENAQILREYNFPDRTAFRDYYTLNAHLNPNWLGHLILAGLLWVFPPLIAEKLLLSGYVILLPLGARYALRALDPESEFLALLAFPFVYNYLLSMGFYNFVYSLPIFFFVVGRWLKDRGMLTPAAVARLAVLNLVLFFSHLVSLVMALGLIALLGLWLTALEAWPRLRGTPGELKVAGPSGLRAIVAAARTRLLPGLVAFVPAFLLATVFLSRKGTNSLSGTAAGGLVRRLLSLDSLNSSHVRELILSTTLAALFGAVTIYLIETKARGRRFVALDALLLVVGLYLVVYFTAPERMAGGEFITERLNLFPYLALLLWFGAQKWDRIAKEIVRLTAIVLAIAMLASQALSYAAIDGQMNEYLSGMSLIEENSTLLPLCFSPFGRGEDGKRLSGRVGIFLHAAGYIAAERRVVEFDNYEANTDYFPTIFRAERNPDDHLAVRKGALETQPPCVDLLSYAGRTGGSVDYVLVWGLRQEHMAHRCVQLAREQLRLAYDLVRTSPAGRMQLYRRKDFISPARSISR